jgi:hypothetical protein
MRPDGISLRNRLGKLDDTEIVEILKSFRTMIEGGGFLEVEESVSEDGIYRSCGEFESLFMMAFFNVVEKIEYMEKCIWRLE